MQPHPIKARRLIMNWTQDQLATYCNVTHDCIVRNEQGLFSLPNPAVISALADLCGESKGTLAKEHLAWVAQKRRSPPLKLRLRRVVTFGPMTKTTAHPFVLWRTVIFGPMSRIAFCQMLCLHPATVLKYETGKQGPMPTQIYGALLEAGMKDEKIQELAVLGVEYFKVVRQKRGLESR